MGLTAWDAISMDIELYVLDDTIVLQMLGNLSLFYLYILLEYV